MNDDPRHRPARRRRGDRRRSTRGLSVVSIAKSYDKKAVLTDVSLGVERGEVVGLLGPNGAGKTTCFYSIMGLVKPDSGRILLDGQDITGLPMYRRADPRPRLSAAGDLDLPRPHRRAEHHGGARGRRARQGRRARERLEQLLAEFHIEPSARRARPWRCRAASGGAARSPARSPPTRRSCCSTSPSPASTRSRSRTFATSSCELKKRDIGVLITDHNVRETLDIVDRACIIYGGQVLFAGSPEDLVADDECPPPLSRRELRAVDAMASSSEAWGMSWDEDGIGPASTFGRASRW